jgi:alpha-ketoglutarate-dependent taurine dioxygenase
MSLLTINKLTASVGAEVIDIDPDRLVADHMLADAVLDALEDNGVVVFPGLNVNPEAQVAFCRRLGAVDHSSDGHHPVAGIYPITLDPSKNASAAYLLRAAGRPARLRHRARQDLQPPLVGGRHGDLG